MSLEEPALAVTRGSAPLDTVVQEGTALPALGAGQGCQAAGARPAPQLVPGALEEQEQADELWNKTHCLM